MDLPSVVEVWLRVHGRERAYGGGAFFDRDRIHFLYFGGGVAASFDLPSFTNLLTNDPKLIIFVLICP